MMQTLAASPVLVKSSTTQRRVARASPAVCQARQNKLAAAVAALPALVATHPALALVDERLNGDGTGKALGVASPLEGVALIVVFGLVWALFQGSGKALDRNIRGSDDDAGLSL